MDKLRKSIINVQKELSKYVPTLNWGGCLRFAYYMSKKLREIDIDHKICYVYDDPIKLTYANYEASSHVFLFIPEIGYFDGHDFLNFESAVKRFGKKYRYYRIDKTSLNKMKFFRDNCCWNSTYDPKDDQILIDVIDKYV